MKKALKRKIIEYRVSGAYQHNIQYAINVNKHAN